jgi:hypothetical protein
MEKIESAMQAKDAGAFVDVLVGAKSDGEEMQRLVSLKELLQAAVGVVGARVAALSKSQVVSAGSVGDTLLFLDNVQCFEPRGRFSLTVTSSTILLQGKAFAVSVPVSSIVQVVRLPSSASAKKEGEDLLAIRLRYTLYSILYTLYTIYYTLYPTYYTLYTILSIKPSSMPYTTHIPQSINPPSQSSREAQHQRLQCAAVEPIPPTQPIRSWGPNPREGGEN